MEKMLKMAKALDLLKTHQVEVINQAQTIEVKADKMGDPLLAETIASIRQKSEQNFTELENAIQNYHLKINALDA